jgi:hypothetical protein
MNPIPRTHEDKDKKLIDEWLKNNKVTKFPYGKRSESLEIKSGFYGRKKKKQKED